MDCQQFPTWTLGNREFVRGNFASSGGVLLVYLVGCNLAEAFADIAWYSDLESPFFLTSRDISSF